MDIGIIGTGDMGKAYALAFNKLGYRVRCCDVGENLNALVERFKGTGIEVTDDGVAVSRVSDLVFYLVETHNMGMAAAMYGPSTKKGAIVSPGTSVMTPAIEALEKNLPSDVHIVPWHWYFGPSLEPQGQQSLVFKHRASRPAYDRAMNAFRQVGTEIIRLQSYKEHDRITADEQAVTQTAFLSMGAAWAERGGFPWENTTYAGGIDNVKVLLCLRMYAGKAHVYSGLAIMNPYAREQVMQYAKSVKELFLLMIQGSEDEFRERVEAAGRYVFGNGDAPILLDDMVLGDYRLGLPPEQRTPNNHLSYLGMVDSWHKLGINPYAHYKICRTPPFMLRLGSAEYLFRHPDLLEESVKTALSGKEIWADDLAFVVAVNDWASIIGHGDMRGYHEKFDNIKAFFPPERLSDGMRVSNGLIRRLQESQRLAA
ncbi:prephenate dehydrogenase [Candidatus Woesearchaeota archaeon]|nr:prephenate dehydrogenase [Candidatus Woesearchaeota archaeon]